MRAMISEVKSFGAGSLFEGYPDFRIGAVVKPGRPLAWRTSANFVLVQISYGMRRLFEWRSQLSFDGRMFAGVLVLASASMARRVNAKLPDIRIPERVIEKLENDPRYGLQVALEQMDTIKESGLFDGVHLVPVGRYAEMAELLRARH